MSDILIDFGIYSCYIMMVVGAVAALLFPVIYFIKHPSEAKGALLGVVAIVLVFGISYIISGDEVLSVYAKFGVDSFQSKLLGSSLIALYLLGIGAVLVAVFAEVSRFFR